jgi:phosphoribosylformylglycinamidine synthase
VGDPFMEKLCVEACLELLATGAVAGIQDMGAAGLTCSTCETAARGGTGIEIELAKVPQRSPGMTPYEILLSESQERMLIIVKKGREEEVKRIFDKWDLPAVEIGSVTDTGQMVVKNHGEAVVDLPAAKLADEAPIYHREAQEPAYLAEVRAFTLDGIEDLEEPAAALEKLLEWPTIASKNWVYRQYDHMVRANTMVNPGSDAAVIRVKADSIPGGDDRNGSFPEKILAISVDCNAVHVYLDPYEGAKAAVAECARNLACSGATPIGTTDNLNFGNPHNPELFWQLKESVRGLAEGCEKFNAPVTGGNVSLYNQNPEGAVDPTPTVAMVGLIEDESHVTTQWFKDEGDAVVLLGEPVDDADPLQGLGGSAYLQVCHDTKNGVPPRCDLEAERTLGTTLLGLIQSGLVQSAHDCAEGGLAVAVAECCFSELTARNTPRMMGAEIDLAEFADHRLDALLFGEAMGRIIITTSELDAVKAVGRARLMGVPARRIGTVGGDELKIKTHAGELACKVAGLHDLWWNAIGNAMT